MSPTSTEISVSITLIEIVAIILPIWLAGIRYFIDELGGEENTIRNFSQMIVLLYVSLTAVLISAGTLLTDIGNPEISMSIYGLWLLFSTTGVLTFKILRQKIETGITPYFLLMGYYTGWFLIISSFFLLMISGLKTI